MVVNIVVIIILILLSAFFSACETALTGVNRIRIKYMAENGSKNAKTALGVMDRFEKALSTILIGNNIVNISTSSIATIMTLAILPEELMKYSAVISTVIVTLVVITFGEILPKTLARMYAEKFVLSISGIMRFLMFIFTPISAIFLLMQNGMAKLFKGGDKDVSVTEEELIHIIEEIEDEGVLEEQESSLVRRALIFDETTVDEILTPRVNITAVAINEDIQKVKDIFVTEGYSRLPVYEKTIDHICGIINIKDFTNRLALGDENVYIRDIMQETMYVPALMKISEVLRLMQKEKIHLAVVVDQYGGTEGIVTLEDVLEELVGEIYDEGDEVYSPVTFTGDNVFEVSGNLSVNDFNRYFSKRGMEFELNTDSNTVGGWAFELFGKIPENNESVKTSDFLVKVLSVSNRRIDKIEFEILKPEN